MSMIDEINAWLRHRLWPEAAQEESLALKLLLNPLRLLYVLGRDLSDGQINLRAMSLVYTSLLSLVPLLAVSFSVLKAFGVHNQVEPFLLNFLAPLGDKGIEISQRIIEFVENIKVGVLGSIGLALLLYTVVSLIQKVESAFNFVWYVERPRSMAQRFSDYLSVILVGPVLVFSALGMTASIMSATVVQKMAAIQPLGLLIELVGQLIPYLLVIAAFTFIYIFMPNTKVKFTAGLVGGVVAGVLWETAGWGFAAFAVRSTKYAAIYSSFAILIMFMIWLYLSWVIVMIGAQVAFYVQNPHFLRLRHRDLPLSNRLKVRLALAVMSLVGRSHYFNEPAWTLDTLARRLSLPSQKVAVAARLLENAGLLVEGYDGRPGFYPARDIETITLAELLNVVHKAGEETVFFNLPDLDLPEVEDILKRVDRAVNEALRGETLKDLVLNKAAMGEPSSTGALMVQGDER